MGTLIGGLIGGALGAWAGGKGGEVAGEAIASIMESPVETVKESSAETVKEISKVDTELNNPFGGAKNTSEPVSSVVSSSSSKTAFNGIGTQSVRVNDVANVQAVTPAVVTSQPERVEAIKPLNRHKEESNTNNSDKSSIVVKNDPALVSEMKKIKNLLTKSNQQAPKRKEAAIPYAIPKAFDDTYLKATAMDLR